MEGRGSETRGEKENVPCAVSIDNVYAVYTSRRHVHSCNNHRASFEWTPARIASRRKILQKQLIMGAYVRTE